MAGPWDQFKLAPEAAPEEEPDTSGLGGEDYLKTLPTGRQNVIKSLAEGRMPLPGGVAAQ